MSPITIGVVAYAVVALISWPALYLTWKWDFIQEVESWDRRDALICALCTLAAAICWPYGWITTALLGWL